MKVVVVCQNYAKDRVLPRYARYLAEGNGWDLSMRALVGYDINYYMAYFDHQKNKDFKGRVAAYFTHREEGKKGDLYDQVAEKVWLRLAMNQGQLRHLRESGPSIAPTLPLERDTFTLRSSKTLLKDSERPVLGFSGFVYGSGRKGEHLANLLTQEFGKHATFRASGRGWPCITKMYNWIYLPDFYKSLDLYICTASVEGGPMTTLEALSTGIPVVIPEDVGIHPELPDIPGIYKYQTGNYRSLSDAVDRALAKLGKHNRADLRESVTKYSVEAFCEETRTYFDENLYGTSQVQAEAEVRPKWPGKSGIYLVAFGEQSRRCAEKCIAACRQYLPGVPIALCSNEPLDAGEDLYIFQKDKDIGGRIAKLKAYDLTPEDWEYVLYLDADTEPVEDFSFLFETLQKGWEVVICKDMDRYSVAKLMMKGDNRPESEATWLLMGTDETLQYNGGVFAFRRNDRVKHFFTLWQEEWQRWAQRDQGALLRALYTQPLKLFVLGNQWNASDRYPAPVGKVAIWHHNVAARRWAGKIRGRLDGTDAWSKVAEWEASRGKVSPRGTI